MYFFLSVWNHVQRLPDRPGSFHGWGTKGHKIILVFLIELAAMINTVLNVWILTKEESSVPTFRICCFSTVHWNNFSIQTSGLVWKSSRRWKGVFSAGTKGSQKLRNVNLRKFQIIKRDKTCPNLFFKVWNHIPTLSIGGFETYF